MLAVGTPVTMRKLRPDRSEVFSWTGAVLQCDEQRIVLRAEFNVDQVDLGFTTFRRGDVFIEFYFWEHWFNIFQISAPDGTLKGWYANLGRPVELESGGNLCYVDLALDVWVHPDGAFLVLDEDEFTAVMEQYPDLQTPAQHGRDELLALVERGDLPRWS
jgi:protein associated with RNAse G/E